MYPYNFTPSTRGINHEEIFVVMPFDRKYDCVFDELIKKAVSNVARRKDVTLRTFRADKDPRTVSGWIEVLEHLNPAKIVLGVLTEEINANVYYELGIAHATQPLSRQVLIAEKNYDPKFDIKDLIFMRYDPLNVSSSISALTTRIENALDSWSYEQELLVNKAIKSLAPYDFEVLIDCGHESYIVMKTSERGPDHYARKIARMHANDPGYVNGVFKRHCEAVVHLQQNGLLGFVTRSTSEGIEIKHYWTDLGNMVLMKFGRICEFERIKRFCDMPAEVR